MKVVKVDAPASLQLVVVHGFSLQRESLIKKLLCIVGGASYILIAWYCLSLRRHFFRM